MKVPKPTPMPMCHRSFAIVALPPKSLFGATPSAETETHTFKSVPCFGPSCALFAVTYDESGAPTGGMCGDLLNALASHRTSLALEDDEDDDGEGEEGEVKTPTLDPPRPLKPIA